MKLNPNNKCCMIVNRINDVILPTLPCFIGNAYLNSVDSSKTFGVMFDCKFTFDKHICFISSLVPQKLGLHRKLCRMFGD